MSNVIDLNSRLKNTKEHDHHQNSRKKKILIEIEEEVYKNLLMVTRLFRKRENGNTVETIASELVNDTYRTRRWTDGN